VGPQRVLNTLVLLLKEHLNFYSSHFFDRAQVRVSSTLYISAVYNTIAHSVQKNPHHTDN